MAHSTVPFAARAGAAVAPVQLPATVEHELDNGLRIVIAPRRQLPLATVHLVLEVGASSDPAGKSGLAAFTADLLRRGTKARSADEIDGTIELVGGRLDTDAGADSSAVLATVPSENLAVAMDVVADVAVRPSFPRAEVDSQRQRSLAELARNLDDPSAVADRSILRGLLPEGHPYRLPIGGVRGTVETFTREDVVRFHGARYAPTRALLLVTGDVEPDEVVALARQHFGAWKSRPPAPVEVPEAPPLERNRILVVHKAGATQAQIRFAAFGVPARTDPDFFPAVVANGAFGGGFTSRLMDEIRVNRGLSYGVRTRFTQLRGGGFFIFSSFTKNESIGELVGVALGQAERARQEGFTDAEIERARSYLTGLYPLRLETNEQTSAAMAEIHLFGLPSDWVTAYRGRLAAVTTEAANDVARRWFFARPFSMVIVGDEPSIRRGLAEAKVEGDVVAMPIERLE